MRLGFPRTTIFGCADPFWGGKGGGLTSMSDKYVRWSIFSGVWGGLGGFRHPDPWRIASPSPCGWIYFVLVQDGRPKEVESGPTRETNPLPPPKG